jgi:hypothetical protein
MPRHERQQSGAFPVLPMTILRFAESEVDLFSGLLGTPPQRLFIGTDWRRNARNCFGAVKRVFAIPARFARHALLAPDFESILPLSIIAP